MVIILNSGAKYDFVPYLFLYLSLQMFGHHEHA